MGPERGWEREAPPAANPAGGLGLLAFLRDADPVSLSAAAPLARWLAIGPGALVLDFGDATDDVFFVVEGAVRVLVRTPLGQEVILGDLGPGDVFGEMAAIDGAPRSANVTALQAARLCRLPAAAFLGVALRSPAVGLRVMRTLTARLRLQDERLFEQVVLPVRHRLASELLRGRRETISLALAELVREGLVEATARAIVLPRPDALRAAINARLRGSAAPAASRSKRPQR